MCMLIAKARGFALPSDEALENSHWSNRDGAGVAWASDDGKVHIKKDFGTLSELKEWLKANIKKSDALLVHFRQATSGGIKVGLRHPFPVTRDAELLLAPELETDLALGHNGIIWKMPDSDTLSDTALFVRDILADENVKANVRESVALQMLISGTIGTTNKLALLWGDGHILTFGEFQKHEGVLYSNGQFKNTVYLGSEGDGTCKQWIENLRSRADRNKDYCHVCYQEFPIKQMFNYAGPDAVKGDRICRNCHSYAQYDKHKIETRRKGDLMIQCHHCNEYVPQSDLNPVFAGDENMAMICTDCEEAYEHNYKEK